jgi:hypothetical protein
LPALLPSPPLTFQAALYDVDDPDPAIFAATYMCECLSVPALVPCPPSLQAALYDVDDPDPEIYAATYMGAMSWKSSIAYKEQALIREDFRCVSVCEKNIS